jgi:hypothetical protein
MLCSEKRQGRSRSAERAEAHPIFSSIRDSFQPRLADSGHARERNSLMSSSLPERPNLRHLKGQARDLLKSGAAASLADAQFSIARQYGFPSWPKLKAHIESLEATGQLKDAIDRNDLEAVKSLMTARPELHRAPLGRGKNGPLTLAAEYRAPGPPPPQRLAIARWMIENGSDVHRGGDAPLMRAALRGDRVPMMELLVAHGADVNAQCGGDYPILFAPCETVDPVALKWLLDHGANPNGPPGCRTTPLDYVIGSYLRSPGSASVSMCWPRPAASPATTCPV